MSIYKEYKMGMVDDAEFRSLIYGVMLAALHTLPGEDYQKLVKKCHELGFNH